MTLLREISIDLDVHKLIEAERRSFEEPPLAALRRLLGLPELQTQAVAPSQEGRSWQSKGVTLPHGTLLRMSYNGREHEGRIEDGAWLVDGMTFKSPSGAACGVARTKDGKPTSLDGWGYWEVKRPSDPSWTKISSLLPR